nr:hypothetical protein [Kibdelosporangium sp. MJ126-NF4]
MELLDALPYLALNLTDAPEQLLRRLFEITQLTIRLYEDSDQVTITIKLPADQLPEIAHAAERITREIPADLPGSCVDAICAPVRLERTGRMLRLVDGGRHPPTDMPSDLVSDVRRCPRVFASGVASRSIDHG